MYTYTVDAMARDYGITESQAEFYMLIGLCIKAWSQVEDELFELCRLTLAADARRVAVIFYKTPQLEARLTLTEELIESMFPVVASGEHTHPTVLEWKRLRKALGKLIPTRNLLAHGTVEQRLYPDTPEHPAVRSGVGADGVRFEIVRPTEANWVKTSEKERLRGKKDEARVDASLHHHLTQVRDAADELSAFRRALAVGPPSTPAPQKSLPVSGKSGSPRGRTRPKR